MKNNNPSENNAINFFAITTGIFFIFATLKILRAALIPFVIAYFIFFALQPIEAYLKKLKLPRFIAILFNLAIIFFFIYLLSFFVIASISSLLSQAPQIQAKLISILQQFALKYELNIDVEHLNYFQLLRNYDFFSLAQSLVDSTISFLGNVILIIIFYIFIHEGHEKILKAFESRFDYYNETNNELNQKIGEVKNAFITISEQIKHYALYKFLISLGTGISFFIVLIIFDINFAPAFAFIAFSFNFIPAIGSIIATVFPVLYSFFQYESLSTTLFIAILLILLQNIFGNIIEPKVLGQKLGINPLAILLSLLIWSYIWGVVGMILAVPLTAIIKIILLNSRNPNVVLISKLLSN